MNSIVVSGIGKRNALLELLAVECAAHDARLCGGDSAEWPPARLVVTHFAMLPPARAAAFRPAYAAMLEHTTASAYLTLIDPEIVSLGELEAEGRANGALFAHPVPETSRICEDKFRFFEVMRDNGIGTIATSLTPPTHAPFIRKDRRGSAGSGFKVHADHMEAEALAADVRAGSYIFQPFCAGRHFCVDAYFALNDGRLIDLCAKEILLKTNGESYMLEAVARERFVEMVEAIAAALPMRGIVNFDIYDDEGVLKVMEVNCRIGGNYPASHAFGCNLLALLLAEVFAGGLPPARSWSHYAVGRRIAKYFAFSPVFDAAAHTP